MERTISHKDEEIIKKVKEMRPFSDINSIPSVPITDSIDVYREYVIPNYIRCGAIPKKDLKDGCTYYGDCRNAEVAVWNASENVFYYKRHKFGYSYDETIRHFEDDDEQDKKDLFVPLFVKN